MPSSDIAVSVCGLSKSYSIAHTAPRPSTFGEAIVQALMSPRRRPEAETFWAVRDVEFDINKGDVVGIIGRNGAGKSTLLKILSRITEPTTGQIDIYGRVGSLLEVGTGFHPELTGRENIFMNGAILGMTRREITKHFDEIVAFAEVEKFLDTPVKRYSSGMYVRLAFAVAAYLNPDILIVDEVLAVGDTEFQKKCLGKIRDVATNGRTVIFVSHHMHSVSTLCRKAIFMENGRLGFMGDTADAIDRYLSSTQVKNGIEVSDLSLREGTGRYRFTSVRADKDFFSSGEDKTIKFRIERQTSSSETYYVSCLIFNRDGLPISQVDGRLVGHSVAGDSVYEGVIRVKTPWLKSGDYRVDMYIFSQDIIDKFENACILHVVPLLPYTFTTDPSATELGIVCTDFTIEDTDILSLTSHSNGSMTPMCG